MTAKDKFDLQKKYSCGLLAHNSFFFFFFNVCPNSEICLRADVLQKSECKVGGPYMSTRH